MANYGYTGNYTTTSYGAQGGAEGGGFVGGSQGGGGSQDSPSGNRTHGKDTLRPVTIKQIIDAEQPHPDSDHKIDGVEVTLITFIGQIHTISPQATNTTYKLDDGTGLIEVKQWIDSEAPESAKVPLAKDGDYLRVYGRIKAFNNKKHIAAHMLRPVADFNEVNYHLLEATSVHLYFVKGPLGGGGAAGVKTEDSDTGMFVDSAGGNAGAGGVMGRKLPAKLSMASKKVFALLSSAPQNNEGLHVHMIATQTGLPVNDVFKAGDELVAEGLIYTTVDDETWAVLEY